MTAFDTNVFLAINGHASWAVLDWWSALVRATEIWLVPALIVLAIVAWRGTPRARLAALLCVAVFVVSDGVFVRSLKIVSQRPRPAALLDGVRSVRLARVEPRIRALGRPLLVEDLGPADPTQTPRSFPSGHAWNSFAIATVLAMAWRRWGWLAFLPAALVGLARVHAGLHWPTDVLASAVLAPPCTLGLVALLERAWRAVARRVRPQWVESVPSLLQRSPVFAHEERSAA